MAAIVLTEHLAIRRGESVTFIHEWELAEAIRMAVPALLAAEREAILMTEAHTLLMASRKRNETSEAA